MYSTKEFLERFLLDYSFTIKKSTVVVCVVDVHRTTIFRIAVTLEIGLNRIYRAGK
jgi:hypothetical protein